VGRDRDLEFPGFWMFSSSTEEAGRFDAKVPYVFFAAVEETGFIFRFKFVAFFLYCGLFFLGKFLFLFLFGFKVFPHGRKIAFLKRLDLGCLSHISIPCTEL
jgi:hypothetical protein